MRWCHKEFLRSDGIVRTLNGAGLRGFGDWFFTLLASRPANKLQRCSSLSRITSAVAPRERLDTRRDSRSRQAVIYRGRWRRVEDDDGHTLVRGQTMAVCVKTFRIYTNTPYADEIIPVPPLRPIPLEEASSFDCFTRHCQARSRNQGSCLPRYHEPSYKLLRPRRIPLVETFLGEGTRNIRM